MSSLYNKVDSFLIDNTNLIDKLYFFKVYLKIKKMLSMGIKNDNISTLHDEIDYIINEQKRDRDYLISMFDYIVKMEENICLKRANNIKTDLILYLNELQHGLVVNEIYLDEKKYSLKNNAPYDGDYNLSFSNIVKTRKNINEKKLILSKNVK